MGNLNLNPDAEIAKKMDYLALQFEKDKKITEPLAHKRQELLSKLADKKIDYARCVYAGIIELEKTSIVAFKALRQELGYPLSEEYIPARRTKIEAIRNSYEEFLRKMGEKLQEETKSEE